MSFFRRLIGALGAASQVRHGIQVGDRYVKTDGQYQSVWVVRQIVHFEGIPPHARLANNHDFDHGYRTISVTALADPDLYRRATADVGRPQGGAPGGRSGAGRGGGASGRYHRGSG
ncbi:hypothetical protein [Roseospira visakhapatnamensis]|uniref:Uncharacterized protein n=1 Tax=Roseospira visakhapatnamensis TaxID=390880 RepID=A0A7W6RAW7_9PROT|nr:hypothetical protein [Roseospira visakhapatnamensis]MBB4264766.1 hypothetical protein [Roseospira visakhapatnamensis]